MMLTDRDARNWAIPEQGLDPPDEDTSVECVGCHERVDISDSFTCARCGRRICEWCRFPCSVCGNQICGACEDGGGKCSVCEEEVE